MPIRNSSLKKFIYAVLGAPAREQVAEYLQRLEKTCFIVNERVALKPECAIHRVSHPIQLTFPPGIVLAPRNFDNVMDLSGGIWSNPSVEPVIRLAQCGSARVQVKLNKFKLKFECSLEGIKSNYQIKITLGDLAGIEQPQWVGHLRTISTFLNLPVSIRDSDATAVHKDGLKASVSSYEPTDRKEKTAYLQCDLSPQLYRALFDQLMFESKGKLVHWHVGISGEVPLAELIAAINNAGFPGKKTEMHYWWRLRNYQDFPAMTDMAVITGTGSVAQSMFEFELKAGRRGQLDMAADKKGKFKLWFSFDTKEDAAELTRMTRIKLKENY